MLLLSYAMFPSPSISLSLSHTHSICISRSRSTAYALFITRLVVVNTAYALFISLFLCCCPYVWVRVGSVFFCVCVWRNDATLFFGKWRSERAKGSSPASALLPTHNCFVWLMFSMLPHSLWSLPLSVTRLLFACECECVASCLTRMCHIFPHVCVWFSWLQTADRKHKIIVPHAQCNAALMPRVQLHLIFIFFLWYIF